MRGRHPVISWWASPTIGCVAFCLSGGLAACGISADVYTRTLHERDQFRARAEQVETEAEDQQRQAVSLRNALTEQQQANRILQAKVSDLEAQTADQNLAQEALAQQLRSLTAEREELLLNQDESRPPSAGLPAGAGEAPSPEVEAGAQRLNVQFHDDITAGHLTVHRLGHRLDLRLTESFLFVPDRIQLTTDGQRLLSTMGAAVSAMPLRRLQLRLSVPPESAGMSPDQAGQTRVMAAARLLALARLFGGAGAESSELVLVTRHRAVPPPQAGAPAPAEPLTAEEIQLLLEWPDGR